MKGDGGPGDYTLGDLIFWGCVMGGIIASYTLLTQFGLHPLVCSGIGLVAGMGIGWAGERLYTQLTRSKKERDHQDDTWH
jgi:hypothetical protein